MGPTNADCAKQFTKIVSILGMERCTLRGAETGDVPGSLLAPTSRHYAMQLNGVDQHGKSVYSGYRLRCSVDPDVQDDSRWPVACVEFCWTPENGLVRGVAGSSICLSAHDVADLREFVVSAERAVKLAYDLARNGHYQKCSCGAPMTKSVAGNVVCGDACFAMGKRRDRERKQNPFSGDLLPLPGLVESLPAFPPIPKTPSGLVDYLSPSEAAAHVARMRAEFLSLMLETLRIDGMDDTPSARASFRARCLALTGASEPTPREWVLAAERARNGSLPPSVEDVNAMIEWI